MLNLVKHQGRNTHGKVGNGRLKDLPEYLVARAAVGHLVSCQRNDGRRRLVGRGGKLKEAQEKGVLGTRIVYENERDGAEQRFWWCTLWPGVSGGLGEWGKEH